MAPSPPAFDDDLDAAPTESVRLRFLWIYLPIVLVFAAIILGAFYVSEYRRTLTELEAKLERLVVNYGIIVAEPLQRRDEVQVALILAASTNDPDLLGMSVRDSTGRVIAVIGDPSQPTRPELMREKSLQLAVESGFEQVGTLLVVLDDLRLAETVDRQLSLMLLLLAAILIAAMFGSLVAHDRSIGRPLRDIVRTLAEQRAGAPRQPLVAERDDEIGALVKAFNGLLARQQAYEDELKNASSLLERRVHDRTVELVAARDAAESASRSKSQFLANLSHELRTPLNAIIGFSELIQAETGKDQSEDAQRQASYADEVHSSGLHLLGLINNLLDLSQAETGSLDLKAGIVDLRDLINGCIDAVSDDARSSNLIIDTEFDRILPPVHADPRLLRQIVSNLLSNALKFSMSGDRVRVRAGKGHNGDVRIEILDTGIGIAPTELERVFRPFEQADANLNRRYSGTGLGLPLAKVLAGLHGGDVYLDSTPGMGTHVTVRLPGSRWITSDDHEAYDDL